MVMWHKRGRLTFSLHPFCELGLRPHTRHFTATNQDYPTMHEKRLTFLITTTFGCAGCAILRFRLEWGFIAVAAQEYSFGYGIQPDGNGRGRHTWRCLKR